MRGWPGSGIEAGPPRQTLFFPVFGSYHIYRHFLKTIDARYLSPLREKSVRTRARVPFLRVGAQRRGAIRTPLGGPGVRSRRITIQLGE